MRLWTLHPRYLDCRGLVALWREALLAQKVLQGATQGYKHHPQLHRFRATPNPEAAIAAYLAGVHEEATKRGYAFDGSKIGSTRTRKKISTTRGQLLFEWRHLRSKLRRRDPAWLRKLRSIKVPQNHPVFRITAGPVQEWERPNAGTPRRRR